MYKTKKRAVSLILNIIVLVLFIILVTTFVPRTISEQSFLMITVVPVIIFTMLLIITDTVRYIYNTRSFELTFEQSENQYIIQFTDRLRFCYTLDDFYKAAQDLLEDKADCSIVFIDVEKNYILYNSPDRITSSAENHALLIGKYSTGLKDGVYFLDDNFELTKNKKHSRIIFLATQKQHLFIFCRYVKLFDESVYEPLFEEFKRFPDRVNMLSNFSEISDLTKEWNQLADSQHSFLPQKLPHAQHLQLAVHYQPLVNVSGDYYSILQLDENKTLVLLGDVSGKGLSAALVMGLVVNTVKIINDKEDLPSMLFAIDKSIKSMKLEDKYTVMFLGIIDTKKMLLRYINASMPEPMVLSKLSDSYRIQHLQSNASVVGIIDITDVEVAEQKLFRGDTILIATDGLSEAMDENGVELSETEYLKTTLKQSASKHPQQFVDDLVALVKDYTKNTKARDDLTILAAKVG
ncbi:MAG: SpoIIE family protein phosphatase [Treponema sp.]|nr:SpoIIE family protein phosphatase [Treponema sp.]